MSAIGITRCGGCTSILDRLREGTAWRPGRRGEWADAGDVSGAGESAGGAVSACIADAPGAIDARALFARALRENSNLEQDWLGLSTLVTAQEELRYCLERALFINPDSAEARQELARLARRQATAPPARWSRRRP